MLRLMRNLLLVRIALSLAVRRRMLALRARRRARRAAWLAGALGAGAAAWWIARRWRPAEEQIGPDWFAPPAPSPKKQRREARRQAARRRAGEALQGQGEVHLEREAD